jgi:hypothetical protein
MNRFHAFTTAGLLCTAVSFGQNLITNPGFESGGTGWTLFAQSGTVAAATVTYPNTGAHGGTRYARVAVTAAAASASENWHIQFQPPTGWSASVGTTYDLKFWAKCDSSRNIHVSVQGSDYSYISGTTYGLTPDWTEYTATYVADAEGSNAVRFHVYVAEGTGVYAFDDFTLTGTAPAGISKGLEKAGQALRIRLESGAMVVSLGKAGTDLVKAELIDLQGVTHSSAQARANGSLRLALPAQNGTYLLRVKSGNEVWVRKVAVP